MSKQQEAMRLALEALESLQGGCTDHDDGTVEAITVWCPEIITALRAALAEPVQEPPCATRKYMPSECPNCASLEAQNTELDRKLAELEAALRAQS